MLTAAYLIDKYHLQRHPEGGYYYETYRSTELVQQHALPQRFSGDRCFSTAIYFLLVGDEFSSFHRIAADEVWHFYAGSPVEIVMIDPKGEAMTVFLGNDPEAGLVYQFRVPAGVWFASRCAVSDGFSFVGCTVAPGFDFADFELAKKEELTSLFPQHEQLISRFSRC